MHYAYAHVPAVAAQPTALPRSVRYLEGYGPASAPAHTDDGGGVVGGLIAIVSLIVLEGLLWLVASVALHPLAPEGFARVVTLQEEVEWQQ